MYSHDGGVFVNPRCLRKHACILSFTLTRSEPVPSVPALNPCSCSSGFSSSSEVLPALPTGRLFRFTAKEPGAGAGMAEGLQKTRGQDQKEKQCPPPLPPAAGCLPLARGWAVGRASIAPVTLSGFLLSPRALVCRWLLGNQWI